MSWLHWWWVAIHLWSWLETVCFFFFFLPIQKCEENNCGKRLCLKPQFEILTLAWILKTLTLSCNPNQNAYTSSLKSSLKPPNPTVKPEDELWTLSPKPPFPQIFPPDRVFRKWKAVFPGGVVANMSWMLNMRKRNDSLQRLVQVQQTHWKKKVQVLWRAARCTRLKF